jgi:hypothetical protein
MAPLHIPLSFGGAHIPQMTPTVGSLPPFHPGSNPSLNAPGWSNQPGGQVVAYVPSFTPTSSTLILTNTFGMTNPPLSSRFPPGGGQFHTLGNPQPGATPAGGNIYNPHHNIPTGMVPNQPLMNQFGGGFYNPWTGPWCIPEPWMGCDSPTSIFPGSLGPDVATPSPFSGHAQFSRLVKINE